MLVLDANILIRAVLGLRVRTLIETYAGSTRLFVPDSALAEAHEHLPAILERRGVEVKRAIAVLDELRAFIQVVDSETYRPFQADAQSRLAGRDLDDWPVLATALALDCAIWTEDTDFFGAGVAVWTTDRVELLLKRG
jgi:predicted nucleic acid-binding protein